MVHCWNCMKLFLFGKFDQKSVVRKITVLTGFFICVHSAQKNRIKHAQIATSS